MCATIKKFFLGQTDADRQTDGNVHRHRSSNSSLDSTIDVAKIKEVLIYCFIH